MLKCTKIEIRPGIEPIVHFQDKHKYARVIGQKVIFRNIYTGLERQVNYSMPVVEQEGAEDKKLTALWDKVLGGVGGRF